MRLQLSKGLRMGPEFRQVPGLCCSSVKLTSACVRVRQQHRAAACAQAAAGRLHCSSAALTSACLQVRQQHWPAADEQGTAGTHGLPAAPVPDPVSHGGLHCDVRLRRPAGHHTAAASPHAQAGVSLCMLQSMCACLPYAAVPFNKACAASLKASALVSSLSQPKLLVSWAVL